VKERVKRVLNFRKPPRAVIIAAVALVAVLSLGCAANRLVTSPNEPPEITVKAGDTEIAWVVGLNHWNGNIYDRLDNFHWFMADKTIEDLAYIRNGEQIEITFEGLAPSTVTLTEYILNEDGSVRYITEKGYITHYNVLNDGRVSLRSFVFTVEPNIASIFSSTAPPNFIKGYRFVVNWHGNECEYGFVIRGN